MRLMKRLWCWAFGHRENVGCPRDPDEPMVLYCQRCYLKLEWPTMERDS
jgi:hypothetical protein